MGNLANAHLRLEHFGAAEALRREQLEIRRRTVGEESPKTLDSEGMLASCLSLQGRYEESGALFREALEASRRVNGENHSRTNDFRYWTACDAIRRGQRREAISFLRDAVDHGFRRRFVDRRPHPDPPIGDDPEFASVRDDPEFEAIVEEMRRRSEEDGGASRRD